MTYAEKLERGQRELDAYIKGRAIHYAERCLNNGGMLHESTCERVGFGWDQKLHRYMGEIVHEMKKMGISCYHTSSYGVDDWHFKVEVK